MFRLASCPPDFAVRPPFSFDHRLTLAGTPEQVFDVVTSVEHESQWFPDFREAHWLAEPGVGAVRDYRLAYMRLLEHFTVWEPGRRLEFWVSQWSIPMLRRFLESYRFEPRGSSHTEMFWRIAYQPLWYLRPLHPIVRPMFARDFRKAARQLETYCEELFGTGRSEVTGPDRESSAPTEPRARECRAG